MEYKTANQRKREQYKTVHNQRMIDLRKPKPRKVGALAERGDFYKHNGYTIHNV